MKQPFMFAVLAATLLGVVPAHAQHIAADLLPPYEVSTIVASMGMRPLDRPIWRNGRYVINAIDRNGREVRVVLDAHDGQVIAVRPRMREYGYEPRYAPPPPPEYPRGGAYDPRYEQRYGVPPVPPAAVPGQAPAYDQDDYFDDERQQGTLTPPGIPSAQREVTTGSVPRRLTVIAPANSKTAAGKSAVGKDAAPIPRPRPMVANAKPGEPKATGNTGTTTGKPAEMNSSGEANAAKSEAAKSEAAKSDAAKPEVRVIDMSKPTNPEKAGEKPGEAIRF